MPTAARGLPIALVLVAATGVLLLITTGLVFAVGYRAARLNTFELVRERSEVVIQSIVERARSHLGPVRAQLDYLAEIIERRRLDLGHVEELGALLAASLAAVPQESAVAFVDPDLRVLRALRNRPIVPTVIDDWREDPSFRTVMTQAMQQGEPHWGELFVVRGKEVPFINLFVPVRSEGRLLGTLIAGVSIEELSRFLATLESEHVTNAFILRGREHVLAHPRLQNGFPGLSDTHPLPTLEELGDPVLSSIWARDGSVGTDGGSADGVETRVVEVRGRSFVFLFQEVSGYGEHTWVVGTYMPLEEALPQLRRLTRLLWVGWLVLLGALGLAFLLGRELSRPIRRLAAAARRVREFQLKAPLIQGHSLFLELNEAAEAHNAMVQELRLFATYVPRSLVRRLIRQRPFQALLSEEREITVLFTDIAGFTAFAERLETAELASFLNQHFALVGACIERQEGTIDKYIGDSVMAFWGAPGEQPEHAERACRAALAIAVALRADNAERSRRGLAPVRLRVGIHSGRALVGDIGAPSRVNYTVVGDVVNAAERLEELARSIVGEGETICVLVSGATAGRLTTDLPLIPLGCRALRGRSETLEVFRLETT